MIYTLKLIQLFFTNLLAAQGVFYLLGGREGLRKVSVAGFAEQRKAIDSIITPRFKLIYLISLISGVWLSFLLFNQSSSLNFIFTLVATLLVLVDILLAVKINIPINKAFQSYPENNGYDWETLQRKWLNFISLRGILSFVAMILLVLSWFE
jgi:uncharacterized membrane protein